MYKFIVNQKYLIDENSKKFSPITNSDGVYFIPLSLANSTTYDANLHLKKLSDLDSLNMTEDYYFQESASLPADGTKQDASGYFRNRKCLGNNNKLVLPEGYYEVTAFYRGIDDYNSEIDVGIYVYDSTGTEVDAIALWNRNWYRSTLNANVVVYVPEGGTIKFRINDSVAASGTNRTLNGSIKRL